MNSVKSIDKLYTVLSTDTAYRTWLNTKPDYIRLGFSSYTVDEYINAYIKEVFIKADLYTFHFSSYDYGVVSNDVRNIVIKPTPRWIRDLESMIFITDNWKGTVKELKQVFVRIDDYYRLKKK